jgi:hypothetical protein
MPPPYSELPPLPRLLPPSLEAMFTCSDESVSPGQSRCRGRYLHSSQIIFDNEYYESLRLEPPRAPRPKGPGTEFAQFINLFGFPEKSQQRRRKKLCCGSAHEVTEEPDHLRGRRFLPPPPQDMTPTFQPRSLTPPPSSHRKHTEPGDPFATTRVIVPELQEPPKPQRSKLRCAIRSPHDALDFDLTGRASQKLHGRRFFDLKR